MTFLCMASSWNEIAYWMVQVERRQVALGVAVVVVVAALAAAEMTETWFEYRARTKRELKKKAKTSLESNMELGEIHSRQKRTIAFPTGSTFTITPVLCIPVISVGDLTGFLDIELPFTIKLPNATQVTYGRNDDDRVGIFSVLVDSLNRFGVDGKACLLRAVCEVAESPLRDDGLLGEILNIVLTTSSGYGSGQQLYEYANAEHYGRAYGDCWAAYPQCPMSLFKLFDGYNEV